MRAHMTLRKLVLIAPVVLAVVLISLPGQASTMLFGQVELTDEPRVDLFFDLAKQDPQIPCSIKRTLPRLVLVGTDNRMRRLVWKRMLRQELFYADRVELDRVEKLASKCNMPIR